jgi:hypothetical protein
MSWHRKWQVPAGNPHLVCGDGCVMCTLWWKADRLLHCPGCGVEIWFRGLHGQVALPQAGVQDSSRVQGHKTVPGFRGTR